MQIDFHFFGIYFLCRAAGVDPEKAKRIAYASQYTDDAKEGDAFRSPDGFEFIPVHSSYSLLRTPFSEKAQREVWLPFHFVPNVEIGETIAERIVTRPDPIVCRSVLSSLRGDLENDYKIGVFLHSWADTWAHQGFSARVGRENNCSNIICHNERRDIASEALSFLALIIGDLELDSIKGVGHVEASTCPDEPYLDWEYVNGFGKLVERNNHDIFVNAAEAIYKFINNDVSQLQARGWDDIVDDISEVFNKKGDAETRSGFWVELISSGNHFGPEEQDININYDEMEWRDEIVDKALEQIKPGADVISSHWYQFNEAARWYKTEVLKAVPDDILDAVIIDDDFEVFI